MWQPDLGSLDRLSQILSQASMADNKTQKAVYQSIDELSKKPEFYNYLAFIVGINNNPNIAVLRQIAALTLKSLINRNFENIPDPNLNYVKGIMLQTFNDPVHAVRRAVALVVIEIIYRSGFHEWPEVLPFLTKNLDSSDAGIVENTIDCISKLVEEFRTNSGSYDFLVSKGLGQPLNELLPKLIQMCSAKVPAEIRAVAIMTLNHFIYASPPEFLLILKDYFALLYDCCADSNNLVRQRACQGLVALLESRKDDMRPFLDKIIERIIPCCGDSDYEVARSACFFWEEFLVQSPDESMNRIYNLRNYFDKLLPVLLQGMKFTDLDRANQDDGEDIEQTSFMGESEEQEDDQENEPEEKRDMHDNGMHTLRRICGQIFEKLSVIFGEEIFERLKERILLCLQSNDWKIKEIGIVVIGALTKGCREAIEKHLKDLIPFFTQSLESTHKFIRSNAMWTLSRFTGWMLNQSQTQPQILQDYIKVILKLTLDKEKSVQQSAVTALIVLMCKEEGELDNYLVEIFQFLKPVYDAYTGQSLVTLYGATGLLADKMPHKFKEKQLLDIIMPVIINKWKTTTSLDRTFPSLIECVKSILRALDEDSKQYLEIFVARDLQLIIEYLEYLKGKSRKHEFQKRELCVRATDQLMLVLQILRADFELLLKNSKLLDLIGECLQNGDIQVKQINISFVGDLCKHCPPAFAGRAEVVLKLLATFLVVPESDKEDISLFNCNNACWSIAELVHAYPKEIAHHLGDLALRFSEILLTKKLNMTFAYNLATVIGRIALHQPKAVAPLLPKITKNWCVAMDNQMVDVAKIQAFKGFLLAVNENVEGVLPDFAFLCIALLVFRHNDQELELASKNLIQGVRKLVGDNWGTIFKDFPPKLLEDLNARFGN